MSNVLNSYEKFDKCFNKTSTDFCLNDCFEYSNFDELKEVKNTEAQELKNLHFKFRHLSIKD